MIRSRAVDLVRAAHPEPVAAVTLVVTALAYTAGRGPLFTVVCGAATLTGQLFVGWTNDLADLRLDANQARSDKPLATGRLPVAPVRVAAVVALALCVPLSLAAGLAAAAAHLVAIAAAGLYNAGVKATPASVLPYAVAFGLVPAFVTLGPPVNHVPAWWATAAAALAGSGAHFAQVLPDIRQDRAAGVLGLPQRLGQGPSTVAAIGLFGAAAALVAVGAPSAPVWIALALTATLMAGVLLSFVRDRPRTAFRMTLIAALVVVAALLLGGARF